MINAIESEFEQHSGTFDKLVNRFPEGPQKQSARTLIEFIAKIRSLANKPKPEETYPHWFGQMRECLSGRDCEEIVVKRLGDVVEQYEIPHQYVFDIFKGIQREAETSAFRDFAALESCAYLNSSAVLLCLAHILGGCRPDESTRIALIELGLADYLLQKLSNFLPQMESKIYFLAALEIRDRGLDLMDLTEPIDDDLWKDLIQFQCLRILDKLQTVRHLRELPRGRFKRALNSVMIENLLLLKKIRRAPLQNLRSRVEVGWGERFRAMFRQWRPFHVTAAS